MSTTRIENSEYIPLPPPDAEVITTACSYCVVACSYKVYRWPVGREGGAAADQNAFGVDFPTGSVPWISRAMHNVGMHEGRPHHMVVIPDPNADVVNRNGNHSVRGGTLAQKIYNPGTPTRDRLKYPMIRIAGVLTPVSWDLATEVMAAVSKHVLKNHGEHAWGMKTYSYEYFENTYAISKLVNRAIGTPVYAPHDKPQDAEDAAGLDDSGVNSFSASYDDWGSCEVAFLSGVDPYETKTVLFTEWMMYGNPDMKMIFVTPHRTMGVEYGIKKGGLWLPITPGTDTALHLALAKIIIDNGWQDQEFISKWINNQWEIEGGYGRGTRNTRWQWRTTWGRWQSDWQDYQKFIAKEKAAELTEAAAITGLPADLIQAAAEMIAKPHADGSRPKTSFMLEKGNYWSNNYMNTASIAALGLICGAGNRPGRVISRGGGHQRGGMSAGGGKGWLSPEKYPGRRKKALNVDRWVIDGKVRFMWTMGVTWFAAMLASQELSSRVADLTVRNPHQPRNVNRDHLADTLIKRVESGGMVLVNSDIYPVDPLNTQYADIVLPAAGWGEVDFTRCNAERRLRLYAKFNDAPGEAKPDWWAISRFAQKMGFDGFDWRASNDIFEEAARFSRGGVLNYYALAVFAKREGKKAHQKLREFGTTGIQTPIRVIDGKLVGTPKLHDPSNNWGELEDVTTDQKWLYAFDTHTGKANLLKTPWVNDSWSDFYEAIKPRPEKGEIWITNGRVNEVWQSGFDDLRKPYLAKRWPWPYILIHPDDAAPHGIESGDLVEVYSDTVYVQTGEPLGIKEKDLSFTELMKNGHIKTTTGQFVAVAIVSDEIRQGIAKAAFNYPGSMANSVCHAVPDPVSGNYRYKLGHGVLRKIGESAYKRNFLEMSLKPRPIA